MKGKIASHVHDGIARIGGISFSDDPEFVRLKDLGLRINERLVYEYDFTDSWQHQIRVEAILAPEPHRRYPVCIDGRRACPPEDCGGPWAKRVYVGIVGRGWPMKIKVQVVIESDGGDTKAVENIAYLERGTLRPEELGL